MGATQIVKRQIAPAIIDDSLIAAGAAIASSKLADGANFIKKDGSVAMTGALSLGNQQINLVGTPSIGTDAANKSYVDTQIANLNSLFSNKGAALAASSTNVTVSNPGTAVFDGVTLSVGQRLLLLGQSTPSQNGLYTFNGSGVALTRDPEMNAWAMVPGALITVDAGGATNGNTVWLSTSASSGTLETTAISFSQVNVAAGISNSNFITRETPSGSVNSSNTTFTLANTPVSGSEMVFINGVLQDAGAGNDYTISGATIIMLTAPITGDKIRVTYRK